MLPEQTENLLSRQPSWMSMGAPVPAHIPGDSTPQKKPVFPGNDAVYGSAVGGGSTSGGGSEGTPQAVRAMVVDGATVSFETINVLTT